MMADSERSKKGFTLVEMLVTLAILAVLATAIMPIAKTAVKREKEIELQRDLRLIREAIDAYKKLADEKKIEVKEDSEGYPPDLETLVKGVEVKVDSSDSAGGSQKSGLRIVKFLRRIPRDPMTDSTDWGLRSYQDEPDSTVWGGENFYDVYTKSNAAALDGTKYRDW
jgi:general secretion pathway protein G